jgi:endonuclease-8
VPEGHEIHGLALEHARDLAGHCINVSSPQGRHPELARVLDGHFLARVEAHGKHLFYTWRDAPFLHIHLGLIGSFEHHPSPAPTPRASVQLRLASPLAAADLVGATTCELLGFPERQAILDRLGPDVLAADADPDRAWQRLTRRSTPIGAALLDQRILAGVGNVYRAEALFVCGIHPARATTSLTRAEFDQLWQTLVSMLRQGVADRRIMTVHPTEGDGLYVYKQPNCRRCGSPVRMWQMGVRRTYACETCQA